jgi:pyruvate dehydrogenase E2 component (dihydrolipoamide acetyltransferase)
MARPIVMPSLGMYTTEGTLTEWLRPPGTEVKAGEPVITITTEKATYEVEAPEAGILHAVAQVGAVIQDQGLLGYILAPGEAPPAEPAAGTPAPAAAGARSAAQGEREGAALANRAGEAVQADAQGGVRPTGEEVRASPVARRLAREQGIDITTLKGTGPGGRIVEADVLAAAADKPPSRAIKQQIPLVGMRKTIADRLRASLSTTAPVTLTREVDAEALFSFRQKQSPKPPYDAILVKAVAAALLEHPELNAVIEGEAILLLGEVHVGFAVAVPGGLLVPVVRDADKRPLADVVADVTSLAGKAKGGQLKAEEMAGGTFTITNLGIYGVDAFTPIINPPQAAILGVGRILPRPAVRDGQLVARRTFVLSLSFDHRVADGAPAAQLLDAIATKVGDEKLLEALAQ